MRGRRRPARSVCRFSFCTGLGSRRVMSSVVVRRHALEPADRHRFVLDAHAAAGRLARTVAGAPENARKHVRAPVDHVGVGITALRDQTDIFRYRRVRRAGPSGNPRPCGSSRAQKCRYSSSNSLETRPATRQLTEGVALQPERDHFPLVGLVIRHESGGGYYWLTKPGRRPILPSWLRPINHKSA